MSALFCSAEVYNVENQGRSLVENLCDSFDGERKREDIGGRWPTRSDDAISENHRRIARR